MDHPDIAKANTLLTELSALPSAQELARQRKLALDTYRIEIGAAKQEGRKEGREEGLREGLRKGGAVLFLDLLRGKFGSIDDATVERVRAAPDEELSRWSQKLLSASTLSEVFSDA